MTTLRLAPLRSRSVSRIKADAAQKRVWTERELRAYWLSVNLAQAKTKQRRAKNDQKKTQRLAALWRGAPPMGSRRPPNSYRVDWA